VWLFQEPRVPYGAEIGGTLATTAITVPGLAQPGGAYSYGVAANGFFYSAGIGAQQPDGSTPSTVEEQTRLVLDKISSILEAAGLSLQDVVKTTVHLQDLVRDFAGFNRIYGEIVPQPYPFRTTVGSQLLGILVEIDVVAALPVKPDQ
jgi:2-iminobutanoate/2-iminopropanoate deaminase